MHLFQLSTGGRETHTEKKVMYGAEIIVLIQRDVLCREMKENVGDDIHEGAVAYFNEAIKSVHYSTKATTPA